MERVKGQGLLLWASWSLSHQLKVVAAELQQPEACANVSMAVCR